MSKIENFFGSREENEVSGFFGLDTSVEPLGPAQAP